VAVLAYELTPEDGRLRPKHVVKEKGECIFETELHCDGNSDIVGRGNLISEELCVNTNLINYSVSKVLL
jgi:hypothetical protein